MSQTNAVIHQNESFHAGYAGRYLTFNLGREFFGLEILKVQEIIGVIKITKMPRSPEYLRGVINLRGKIVPVLDLRLRFCMETKEHTEKTVIIVVQVSSGDSEHTTGFLVDQVNEVLDVSDAEIEPPPEFGDETNTGFIKAMGKVSDNVVMLLDIDKVLTHEEIIQLGNL